MPLSRLLLLLSLSLGAGPVSAQTGAAPATVTTVAPGFPAMTQPITLELLPAGTVVLAGGRYLISNYGGLGIDIYIYSPAPLRIAAPSEQTAFEANYAQLTGTALPAPAAPAVPAGAPLSPAPSPAAPGTTQLPPFLSGSFQGQTREDVTVISFALTNRSPALTVRLDPSSLTIRQGDAFLSGRLNTRDSSGQPGLLPPSSAQIGSLSLRTTQPGPITVQWAAVDVVTGQRYPISFTYIPK